MSKDSHKIMTNRLMDDIIDLVLVFCFRLLMSIPLAIGTAIEEMRELWG